jgi:hypothetical protein
MFSPSLKADRGVLGSKAFLITESSLAYEKRHWPGL